MPMKTKSQFISTPRKAIWIAKYWLLVDEMDIKEEFSYNMAPKDKREIRKIIFQNFDS